MSSPPANPLALFRSSTARWFAETFEYPTPIQSQGWQEIARANHALLIAPTGSGKTLAAFLFAIDRLLRLRADADAGVRVLYVSPLKALVYDIERNLRVPLVGIQRTAERIGETVRQPSVSVRTGDTSPRDRQRQIRRPGDILVTTPESLYLMLGSQARQTLRSVEYVIVDEVHALAPTKRGAHLALSLERLAANAERDPVRIGLSATATPTDEVARFLGGRRDVSVVDTSQSPSIEVRIEVPVENMTRPEAWEGDTAKAEAELRSTELDPNGPAAEVEEVASRRHGIWPAMYPRLIEQIRANRTTILFVNSRGLCERLAQQLNEHADEPLVRAHHGSLAHDQRRDIEEMMKRGQLRGIVATSSLELGIDMGTVDLVIMVESPASVSSGLQRIGRAGHGVGEISKGLVFPKHRGDLLEAAVVAQRMADGAIEPIRVPKNPLDVLAQQIVAISASEAIAVDDLESLVRGAANYRDLPTEAFVGLLDMLSGKYPSNEFAELKPRILWDRDSEVVSGRRGSRMLAAVSGGTIPDRGLYGVHLGEGGPRIGELDEEMVHETIAGQTFMLGASTWRVEEITRDRVLVSPAPGEPGKLPFWHGEGPGRPLELGRALGAFTREIGELDESRAQALLERDFRLAPWAASNLTRFLQEQKNETGTLPTDRAITVERFRDELGDWRVCVLSPFGARVHAPWALALQGELSKRAGFEVQAMWSDDGIVMTVADGDEPPAAEDLIPSPDEIRERVVDQLARSALFASHFRENAARSLLLPRRSPTARTPLWAQRLRSQKLLGVAQNYPAFPIVIETYRSILQDVFDLPALIEVLRSIGQRRIRVDEVETASASPFARSLVFSYVAAYMYEGDSPIAERRAQALSLDRKLLHELLGQDELRELLDAAVIDELEEQLQRLDAERRVKHADQLHDLLRVLGDLTLDEIRARSADEPSPWLDDLRRQRRAVPLRIAGRSSWVAIEDVATYRDALGAQPPAGLPGSFLEPVEHPLTQLAGRYARTHGPFDTAQFAARYGIDHTRADRTLGKLEREGRLARGEFRPHGPEIEWCDLDVLRRIKRRTLAKLRNEVAPVDAQTVARFLPAWHRIGEARIGAGRLEEVITQLEGLPVSYAELERVILPSRIPGFRPSQLDELGAMGWLVWVGHQPLGKDDGKIVLYRRDQVSRWLEPKSGESDDTSELDDRHRAILDHLGRRGACFFAELQSIDTGHGPVELLEALWDLVWAGRVTNDTFNALRTLSHRHVKRRRRQAPAAGGRWSLVDDLVTTPTSPTERAHARCVAMLERHGVVSRHVVGIENLPGGFGPAYRVLKAMEESGKVRRGYFVESMGGAQFASSGAVDRLRGIRSELGETDAFVLSAVDPANAFGWLLPWPSTNGDEGRSPPKRTAGATVVIVSGQPILYVDRSGRRIRTFRGAERADLLRAAKELRHVAARRRGRLLRIEVIDDEPARRSPHAEVFREASFSADHRGLVLTTADTRASSER